MNFKKFSFFLVTAILILILIMGLSRFDVYASTVFSAVNITSIHTCPLDTHTFVIVYSDEDNDDVSFQIYDTNGTQILAETDVDNTAGSMVTTGVSVSAFNSSHFVIGWYDNPDSDATFAVYDTTGALVSGPIDVNTLAGGFRSISVSCFNSTHFVIGHYDANQRDATFHICLANGTILYGPIDANTNVGDSFSVSVSALNSTHFVFGWYDASFACASFAIYDSTGTLKSGPTNADATVGFASWSVSVSALNSTYFIMGWADSADNDTTFSVYTSSSVLISGPIDVDTSVAYSCSVQVCALNSTVFVISWRDDTDFDLTFAIYDSAGTNLVVATDLESWPDATNTPFRYHSPCSQETATNIKIYNDYWLIAYANTTTQAIFQTFKADGTTWNGLLTHAPSIGSPTVTWDDTDNCYAQKQAYTVQVVYTDLGTFPDIDFCELYLKTGANVTRAEFAFDEDTSTFSTVAGSTEWTMSGTNTSAGNTITITWTLTAQWDVTEESDLDLFFFANDTAASFGNSLYDANFDVVTRLVTSGLASDDSRINIAGTTTISGTVYYANDPASNVASTSYPPNAEFTSVSIHDAAHAVQDTDVTVVNGAFSTSFAIPATVQSNTYHVYLAMADADYTDADAPDGDTTAVIGDAVMLFLSIDDNRIDVGATAYANLNATYAFDGTDITDGTIQLNGTNMLYQSGSWWRLAITQAVVGQYVYCVNSVIGNTFGITQLGIISLNGIADRFVIPDDADFAFSAFTVAVWAKPTISITDGYLISQYDVVTGDGFNLYQTSDRGDGTAAWIFECIVGGVGDFCYSDVPPVAGAWQHVVGMRDASGNLKMYIDGLLQADTAIVAGGVIDSTSSIYIGTLFGGLPAVDYDGYLCEHRFYNRQLLIAEIYQLYQGRQTNNTGLVALYSRPSYDMDDALWRDLSGNGHDGVIAGVTVIAGLSTDETVRPVFDSLMVFNVQVPQYQGSGGFYYQAQIEWVWDSVVIPSATVGVAFPNGTVISSSLTSNSTGWLTFVINQGNATNGNFIIYGIDDNYWDITVAGSNKTFTLWDWALATKDIDGNALSNTNINITKAPTTVWAGTACTLYVPADTFAIYVTWLQNLPVNTTAAVVIGGASATNFNCTVYALSGTSYHFATNTTISANSYASEILTVSFSGATSTYTFVIDKPQKPTYIINATYDYATHYTTYLALPHYGNQTLQVSFEWGTDLYIQKTTHKLLTVTMVGQLMSITATGTVGDIATAEVYCGARGNPVTTTGWTGTSYSSTLRVLTGTFTFASDKTVAMTWVSSGGSTGGTTPPAISPLIATVIVNFPLKNTQGTIINANVSITWTGVTVVTVNEIFIDSTEYAGWQLLVPDGLPQQLTITGTMGQATIPITLEPPEDAEPGTYIVPCIVSFGWESGAGTKTFRTVSNLDIILPPPTVPDLMTYWWLIMFGALAVGMLVLRGTRKH